MEGMYDWPYYIPFNSHENYPVPTRCPIPSPYMDDGFYRDRFTPVYFPPCQPRTRTRTRTRIPTRSDYAVKIQKVFRGFRVRKNLRKIIELKRGVDEVERNLMRDDVIELIIRDDRYRLKVIEGLMALLLKLDSVVALNDDVRVCRKVVIRKAISLQEMIDSLVVEETLEPIAEETLETLEPIAEETPTLDPIAEETLDVLPIIKTLDEMPIVEETLALEETLPSEETLVSIDSVAIDKFNSEESQLGGGKVCEFEKQGWLVVEEEEDNKVLMSKMAEDNRRLMKMVAELCKKNDNQMRLIQTLSNRVDQLEQALNDRITTKTIR